MGLNKKRIGSLISLNNKKNTDNLDLPFYGINKDKCFMPTVASTDNLDRQKYKIVSRGTFVFSGMQTGRDMCIRIGLYDLDFDSLISPAYTTFNVTSEELVPEYLFMIFKSSEKDRYGAFLSDGSIRSNLDWDVFCNIELELPSIDVQKKYVNAYLGMQDNVNALQKSIEQMQKTCELYMENLVQSIEKKEIGDYIHTIDNRNDDLTLGLDSVRGISNTKEIMPTKADVKDCVIDKFYIINPHEFIYNPRTTRMGDKVGLAYNNTSSPLLFTFNNIAFALNDGAEKNLLADYLYIFFRRSEFDRFARVNSWGSATELFAFDDLCRYRIPIPDIKVQKSIVDIFGVLNRRKELAARLLEVQKNICPVLVRGAIAEGSR